MRSRQRDEIRFFPNFMLRELMAWYIALGLLGALAALFPWSLGVKADPFASAPAGIKPEWYFLFMFQTLKLIPAKVLGSRRRDARHPCVRGPTCAGAAAAVPRPRETRQYTALDQWLGLHVYRIHGRNDRLWVGGKVRRMNRNSVVLLMAAWLVGSVGFASPQSKNSCLDCHSNLPEPLGVNAETYNQSIHAQKGISCIACHGGDASSDDTDKAMARSAGWKGKIERRQIPELCSSCHSDAERMKRYNPALRVDQLQQYKTSVHGIKWAKGDTKVAVCTDCHGVHEIRAPSDPRSKVHPTNVAITCSRCHADDGYMKAYGIKTDQFANYQESVHHEAMTVRGDLSAPTCTTCHGNHGASPPGVADVTKVCSNCHAFQAQLFDTSPHKQPFTSMGLPGCVTCHSNHRIQHPTDKMIGTNPEAVCMQCHAQGDVGFQQAAAIKQQLASLASSVSASEEILGRAERQGMEVSQAQQQQAQARDALMKARVTVHSFRESEVKRDTDTGFAVAKQTYTAGQKAMEEWRYRRIGLGLSLLMIALTVVGLGLYIRNTEKK